MSTFTPTTPFNLTNERDWAPDLGMLDWDTTKIVFSKRTLLEFLKYTGCTVDTNFHNISKLPRYAQFGKLSEGAAAAAVSTPTPNTAAPAAPNTEGSEEFKPTRRVRDPPGGKSHFSLFGGDEYGEDALAGAPPPAPGAQTVAAPAITPIQPKTKEEEEYGLNMPSSRSQDRVSKEEPAGAMSWDQPEPQVHAKKAENKPTVLKNFWDDQGPEEFKPTRRVREQPGGGSSSIQFGM